MRPGGDVKSAGSILDLDLGGSNTGIHVCKILPNSTIKISVLYCITR